MSPSLHSFCGRFPHLTSFMSTREMSFLSELEQDPFDGDEFVERLAWRSTGGRYDSFDASLLHEAFESGVKDLKSILDNHHKKCERLEMVCKEEEKCHWLRVTQLQERAKTCLSSFSELDQRLELVSAKVVYLGDQLEGVNTPRARAVEAHKLMTVFASFLSSKEDNEVTSADVIQKLSLIAHELPSGPRFESARKTIALKYDSIERQLIEEFVLSHKRDDRTTMRSIAVTLSSFKGYSQCVDAFIESVQSSTQRDVFTEIPLLCAKNETLIAEVFPNPRDVTSKLVLNVFHSRLQPLITETLSSSESDEQFLSNLFELFRKTQQMSQQLERMCEKAFLHKMTKSIFSRFLTNYIQRETQCLRDKCQQILFRFYEQRGHQKRALNSLQEQIKRDFQQKIGSVKTRDESLLSEEVAISLLQETRVALKRCETLSRPQDLSDHVMQILEIEIQFLCIEHMEYAVELALQSITETKSELHFLEVTRQANAISHLFEKQFHDSVVPLVHGSQCLKRKRELSQQLEHKLNAGLERCLSLVVTWVRNLLQSEQKKTDFKPETEDVVMATQTQASAKVVRLVSAQVTKIRDCVDGRNLETILTELGIRVHRAIVDHFHQFQFSIVGAMVAICDVNEYRKCAQEFKVPLLGELFGGLHALFNLLIVSPENLKHAMEEISLERSVVLQFIQLRADYKSLRHHFR